MADFEKLVNEALAAAMCRADNPSQSNKSRYEDARTALLDAIKALEAERDALRDALWKACGDDAANVDDCLAAVGYDRARGAA